jgi:hypothetical protein
MFNVAALARAQGWEPDQVRAILERHQIPKKSSDRTDTDWRRLERLLLRTPNEPVHEGVASAPQVPSVGDRVRLKNTSQEYTVLVIFEVAEGGDSPPERWARLLDDHEGIAIWKLIQLEAL